jgi:hypothetical protein
MDRYKRYRALQLAARAVKKYLESAEYTVEEVETTSMQERILNTVHAVHGRETVAIGIIVHEQED